MNVSACINKHNGMMFCDILSMMFQHFEYNISHFCTIAQCICASSTQNVNDQAIKDNFCRLKILIPVANASAGDMYATTSCFLNHYQINCFSVVTFSLCMN